MYKSILFSNRPKCVACYNYDNIQSEIIFAVNFSEEKMCLLTRRCFFSQKKERLYFISIQTTTPNKIFKHSQIGE